MASFQKNFTILMTLQVSTYLAPLLTLPWLARVLGPNEYGRLSFGLAFTAYFISLTNFSFSLTATPKISINRESREQRSKVFWETIITQAALAVAGSLRPARADVVHTLSERVSRVADHRLWPGRSVRC